MATGHIHSIDTIDLLYSGQVRAANPNVASIPEQHEKRAVDSAWKCGDIHFCFACSHSSAFICHKLLLIYITRFTIYCIRKWAFIFSFIQEIKFLSFFYLKFSGLGICVAPVWQKNDNRRRMLTYFKQSKVKFLSVFGYMKTQSGHQRTVLGMLYKLRNYVYIYYISFSH